MKSFKHVVNNINKLSYFWNLSISDLSRLTEISIPGLKKMMDNGAFKLENLRAISIALNVPVIVLLADEIRIAEDVNGSNYRNIKIYWKANNVEGIKTTKGDHNALLSVSYQNDEYPQSREDEIEIINLRTELHEAKERIKFLSEQIEFYKYKAESIDKIAENTIKNWEEKLKNYSDLLELYESMVPKNNIVKPKNDENP
jgi:hypothetical protein